MQSLFEIQERMAAAIVGGESAPVAVALRGGREPEQRFAIHRRHYEASLVAALCQKFPACQWLVGEGFVGAAARAYVHAQPPGQPCIAEYGQAFPAFLAHAARDLWLPYLEAFATLEWTAGRATLATESPPLAWDELARFGGEHLLDARLALQPGAIYVRFDCSIDELLQAYLAARAPDRFVLVRVDCLLEVRGARGSLTLTRLDAGTFEFRARLAAGEAVGAAAAAALDADSGFDAGRALRRVVDAGLVVGSVGSL